MKSAQLIVIGLILNNIFVAVLGKIATSSERSHEQVFKFLKNKETYAKLLHDVRDGTKAAIDTCATLFKNEPWDCYVEEKLKSVPAFFGKILPANREGAFLHGTASASVMYTLTRNCRQGRYADCACVQINRPPKPGQSWRWAGCRENLKFGENMAKHFIDKLEQIPKDRQRSALNLHNNEVGRKVVKIAAKKVCRCHGTTGSCQLKTCWKELLQFGKVGEMLKEKYDQAVRVNYVNNTIQPVRESSSAKGHLVFFDLSPDYCEPDRFTGFPGMLGRKCIPGNDETQKCNRMCTLCGLKSRNDVIVESVKCQCEFVWCCSVRCQTCDKQVEVITCV